MRLRHGNIARRLGDTVPKGLQIADSLRLREAVEPCRFRDRSRLHFSPRRQATAHLTVGPCSIFGANVPKRAFSGVAAPSGKHEGSRSRDARKRRVERSRPPAMGIGRARAGSSARRGRRQRAAPAEDCVLERLAGGCRIAPVKRSRSSRGGGHRAGVWPARAGRRPWPRDGGRKASWAAGSEGQVRPVRRRRQRFDDDKAPGPAAGTAGDVLAGEP